MPYPFARRGKPLRWEPPLMNSKQMHYHISDSLRTALHRAWDREYSPQRKKKGGVGAAEMLGNLKSCDGCH